MYKKLLVLIMMLFVFSVQANQSFMPRNNYYIPSYEKSVSSMTEADFNYAIDIVNIAYKTVFKESYDSDLTFERNWNDGTVNAYAKQVGNKWIVAMFGGLARHDLMTTDGFRAVICHEIGHHIGGAPFYTSWWGGTQWASAEGQADYFATSKCLKMTFEKEAELTIQKLWAAETEEEKFIQKTCLEAFAGSFEAASCYRASLAGVTLAKVLNSLGNPISISVLNPDKSVIAKTNTAGYPGIQCRLDSYFQGALCNANPELLASKTDPFEAFCSRSAGDEIGVRPLCWFNPSDYQ